MITTINEFKKYILESISNIDTITREQYDNILKNMLETKNAAIDDFIKILNFDKIATDARNLGETFGEFTKFDTESSTAEYTLDIGIDILSVECISTYSIDNYRPNYYNSSGNGRDPESEDWDNAEYDLNYVKSTMQIYIHPDNVGTTIFDGKINNMEYVNFLTNLISAREIEKLEQTFDEKFDDNY